MINKLLLEHNEIRAIKKLLISVSKEFITTEDSLFLKDSSIIAHEMPLRVRKFINDFRLKETNDAVACVISGYPIDFKKIGLTPLSRNKKNDSIKTLEEQIFLTLLGTLLGDLIAWATQQAGHVLHDISPVKGQEIAQTGSSSKQELFLHTEDAFHAYRADYFGMICLRNNNQASTTIASRQLLDFLPNDVLSTLFKPRFYIKPDTSQFEKHDFPDINELSKSDFEHFLVSSQERIKSMNRNPEPISILFGSQSSPYIRFDCANYMGALDDEAEVAIKKLREELNNTKADLTLQAGEVCFIDNFRAVHGRTPFKYPPKFDGSDRWMKRINITRDLRKSRGSRMSNNSRIIF